MSEYKLENVEIVKIYRSDKNREGQPFVSSKGNEFEKVDIYIEPRLVDNDEFKGKMSYFDYYGKSANWNIGSTISGTVTQNGQYFNFNPPMTGKRAMDTDMKEIQQAIEELQIKVFGSKGLQGQKKVEQAMEFTKALTETPEKEEEDLDLPF